MRTIAISTLLAVSACSSNYIPQQRGRVAVIMKTGQPAYVRDGRVYEHGLLGGGLEEVVAGHPAATVAANEYTDRLKWGLVGMLLGSAAMIGGMTYAISEAEPFDEDNNDDSERGAYIALGGAIVMIVGAFYLASAEPYRWDAINIFNDSPPPPAQLPGTPGYGFSAKRETMKMRE